MHILTRPLTIEDWLGNIYLLTPINNNSNTNNDIIDTKSFKNPDHKERRTNMIRKVMVADNIDKSKIKTLLKCLSRQLGIDINYEKVNVFQLKTNSSNIKFGSIDRNADSPFNVDNQFSISEKYENIDFDKNMSDDSSHENPNILNIDNFNYEDSSTKFKDQGTNINEINELDDEIIKYQFFICFHTVEKFVENYFILPDDKLDCFPISARKLFKQISNLSKITLEHYICNIEHESETKIKFKPVEENIQIKNLLYRKVTIYARNSISLHYALNLLKHTLPEMINNSVFYNEIPDLNYNDTYSSKIRKPTIYFAKENSLEESISSINSSKKISKIPVLIALKNKLKFMQQTHIPKEVYPEMKIHISQNNS